ncbi:MAG TPA: gamma-glutamyl-gamma-aminobutyrate hydrolase family protein [Acidobacteriaceae bacterium]|jgi:putative glutamine amidotransferase|nr:gamma-glutamyl-gamma-aminobutyrate hydrolase family protein [Acidobacteriaceae bacterium]
MRPRIAIPLPTANDVEYNARSWVQYATAVERAGGEAVEVALTLSPADIARLASSCQGILLPGSPADVNPHKYGAERQPETAPADPARENVDELLLQDAHNLYKPLLCICYGTQSLNVWRTGTLVQDLLPIPVNHRARGVIAAHSAALLPGSRLAAILEGAKDVEHTADTLRLPVNSSHHQAIGIPGDGLRVVARCPQDGVVEAVEGQSAEHFVLGLQWHPERTMEQSSASCVIFAHFIQTAEVWQPRAVRESIG